MKITIPKPWGYEEIWAHVPNLYVGKFLVVNPKQSLSVQYHIKKTETMYLVSGDISLHLKIDNKEFIHDFSKGSYTIYPNTIHWITSEKGGTVCEVSTDYLDDVVRLQDRYGREDNLKTE